MHAIFYWLAEEIWIHFEFFFVPLEDEEAPKSLKPITPKIKGV
jgi:hypothetical protein